MSSRMDRYNNEVEENVNSRVDKNTSLYEDIKRSSFSRVTNNDNIRVIESNGKTIDINKIRKYILENKEEPRVRKIITVPEEKVEASKVSEEKKVYDINSVLEKARKSRELDYENERHKKISEQGYSVLNELKEYEKEEDSYEEEGLNTEERTLVDLINTVTVHKGEVNLLEELMSSDKDEEVTSPIKEEQEKSSLLTEIQSKQNIKETEKTQELVNLKQKINDIDKSFYTNSMSFSKEDFEGFEELEKSVKKSGHFATIGIILLCVASLVTLVVIANYIFELGLF
ncbi:hypothetical protein [uncultured Clostridium sp.]|uniref:hypothetical protein n=1 Tax=uncultured Clostridium sp. TaxID=59620 RepID=UPI0025EF9EE9|nr:hypothetical protein [uncultured Clostridium sp.]